MEIFQRVSAEKTVNRAHILLFDNNDTAAYTIIGVQRYLRFEEEWKL